MKKQIIFVSLIVMSLIINAQTWGGSGSQTGSAYRTGAVGVGTTSPIDQLHINVTTPGNGLTITQSGFQSSGLHLNPATGHSWSLYSLGTNDGWCGAGGLAIYDAYGSPSEPRLLIDPVGNVNVGNYNGLNKVVMGVAGGAGLGYGTGYIGLNASRQSSSVWNIGADGVHNGGGAIWGDVLGNMYFATVPHTGSSAQSLTDANIMSDAKLIVDSKGLISVLCFKPNLTDDAFIIRDALLPVAPGSINFKVKKNGVVYAREINVQVTDFPDYVFNKDYKLPSLTQLETYINLNHHLPNVPSSKEIEYSGANLGDLSKVQMEKIEELTLYVIELKKEIELLKAKIK